MSSAVDDDTSPEVVSGGPCDQGKLPFDLTRDPSDLKIGFGQLKENPELASDQPFDIKMVDYLNNYAADYNTALKNGTLTLDQLILLSDLNEDLKVMGLLQSSLMGQSVIQTPTGSGIHFTNALSVFLNG